MSNLFTHRQLIHIAARNGHSALLGELLKRGADINALDFVCASPTSGSPCSLRAQASPLCFTRDWLPGRYEADSSALGLPTGPRSYRRDAHRARRRYQGVCLLQIASSSGVAIQNSVAVQGHMP